MRSRSCKRCGSVFETDRQGAYLCPACSRHSSRELFLRQRVCKDCGATFTGYPSSKRCPDCQAAADRDAARRYARNGAARPIGSTDICQKCGAEYIVNSGLQKYCKDCSEAAIREKISARKRAYNASNKSWLYPLKEENRSNRNVCIICGTVFDASTARVTCSQECDKRRRKLNQDKADIKRGKRKSPAGVPYDSGKPKSGIVGVTASKTGRWCAAYKGKYIGTYGTIPEASQAIEKYKAELEDNK